MRQVHRLKVTHKQVYLVTVDDEREMPTDDIEHIAIYMVGRESDGVETLSNDWSCGRITTKFITEVEEEDEE